METKQTKHTRYNRSAKGRARNALYEGSEKGRARSQNRPWLKVQERLLKNRRRSAVKRLEGPR